MSDDQPLLFCNRRIGFFDHPSLLRKDLKVVALEIEEADERHLNHDKVSGKVLVDFKPIHNEIPYSLLYDFLIQFGLDRQ